MLYVLPYIKQYIFIYNTKYKYVYMCYIIWNKKIIECNHRIFSRLFFRLAMCLEILSMWLLTDLPHFLNGCRLVHCMDVS